MSDLNAIDVIAPNFKKRLSGVTATVARLVPLQANHIAITTCAPQVPETVPNIHWAKLLTMSRRPRVWHARRNVEMIAGIALKLVFRKRLKLVFTSASQREHSRLTRALIRRMDAVIATSEKTAAYLEHPASVILHGIDTNTFTPSRNRAALRSRLGLPEQGPLIGCFGRIRSQKGTDVFVEAMIRLMRSRPDAVAVVMGRVTSSHQRFLARLKNQVAEASLTDRILFLPEVPVWEMAQFYQVLDLYIAPQRWEGFGLTPLEAMATGCPVVATTVGAFDELLTPQTGCLIAPDDPQVMCDVCVKLLADSEKLGGMRESSRQHVVDHFTLESEAFAITRVYRELLSNA